MTLKDTHKKTSESFCVPGGKGYFELRMINGNGLACYTLVLVVNLEPDVQSIDASCQLNVSWKSNNDDHIHMHMLPEHFSATFMHDDNTWGLALHPTPPSDETLRIVFKMSDLFVTEG